MMKHLLLALFIGLFSQSAWAGWVVTYKDSESGERSQDYYEGGKASFGEVIYAGKHFLLVNQDSRAYWKGTPQQYCNALKAQMQKMMAATEALYAKNPEYRPVPISQRKVTRKKVGTKSIAGFSATGYNFYVDGSQEGQIWVSSDSDLSGIIDFQRSKSKEMECFDSMSSTTVEESKLYKQTVEGTFLLKEGWRQVVSVEKKRVSSSHFDAPSGYKSFSDYQKFYDHISNNLRSSSRASSKSSAPPSFDMPERSSGDVRPESENQGRNRGQEEDNVVVKDAKDVGSGAVDEAHQSTKRGIQDGISESIQEGVGDLMDKWGF